MAYAIRIQTLGDLDAHGYGMNATCEKCRHRADLDMQALIAKFGVSFCYIGSSFDRFFVCGRAAQGKSAWRIAASCMASSR